MARRSRLDIHIGVAANQAVAGLNKVNRSLFSMRGLVKALAAGVSVGGFASLGVAATKASFDFESLKLRLEAVTGSAKNARRIFKEVFDLFIRSPLMLEPLLKARILLEGINVRGKKAMNAVAEASVALGKNILEVAGAVASLETEPLRRMGIELRRIGDRGTITFRDRLNRQIKLVGRSTEELRSLLLATFGTKFGGFLGKAALTGSGLISTYQGSMRAALAQIGDAFAPEVKRGIRTINDALIEMLESRQFFRLSAQFTGPLMKGWKEFVREVKSGGLVQALRSAATKAIMFMSDALHDLMILIRRKVLGPLFKDIGAFLESIELQLLPGFKPRRVVPKGQLTDAAAIFHGNALVDPLKQPFLNAFPPVVPTKTFRGQLFGQRQTISDFMSDRHKTRIGGRFLGEPEGGTRDLYRGNNKPKVDGRGRLSVTVDDTGDEAADKKRAQEIGKQVAAAIARHMNTAQ